MAVKKHLLLTSVTAPFVRAPQTGRKTGYALFLEVKRSPRRTKASKVFAESSIFQGAVRSAGVAFRGNLEQIYILKTQDVVARIPLERQCGDAIAAILC